MNHHAHPTSSSAAAWLRGAAPHALELLEARQLRDALKVLLRREQAAMAEFLVALAHFDRRRGWEQLGHANLFAFLRVELGLSRSAAFYRKSAAELLQDFPEVIEPLRIGRLCLSTIAELAKVLTAENRAEVTPRFFGLSAREAQELVAALQPRPVPSTRMVVTKVLNQSVAPSASTTQHLITLAVAAPVDANPNMVPPSRVLTSELANEGVSRLAAKRDEIMPLTADLRRLHFNVGKHVVKKLEAARDGLSHSIHGSTMEQVLEAALDLLLAKQARARGQVKRPRTTLAMASPHAEAPGTSVAVSRETVPPLALVPTEPPAVEPLHRRTGPRETIPAAVRRAVWVRDGGRCTWPLDAGGVCGSTRCLELDHLIPWADWGPSTVENLRVVCGRHNALAARQAFGARCVERYARPRGRHGAPGGVR